MTRRSRWLRALLPVAILGVAAALVAALILTRPEQVGEDPEERSWPVRSETVEPGFHQPKLRLFGHVESPRVSTLTAAVEADVNDVPVRDGDQVDQGQRLVRLDRSDLESVLQAASADVRELEAALRQERLAVEADKDGLDAEQARLQLMERRVERLEALRESDGVSESDVDEAREARIQQRLQVIARREAVAGAEARLDAAEARLQRARADRDQAARNLERAGVHAPFAGRIAEVDVAPGDRVSPGAALVTLYDTAALEIRAHLPAGHLGGVRRALAAGNGLRAEADVDGDRYEATLERLSGRSPRGEGGQAGLFVLEGRNDDIPLERFASIRVELPPEPETVLLPYEAVYGRDRIFRIVDGRLEALQAVRLGEATRPDGRRGALLRVPALEAGDRILVTQIPQAVDGLRVRVEGDDGS